MRLSVNTTVRGPMGAGASVGLIGFAQPATNLESCRASAPLRGTHTVFCAALPAYKSGWAQPHFIVL